MKQARNAKRKAQRASAPGDGAQGRLRRAVNRDGQGVCGKCMLLLPAASLEMDHLIPLADGGVDFDSNVWSLCKPCHKEKTTAEHQRRMKKGMHKW